MHELLTCKSHLRVKDWDRQNFSPLRIRRFVIGARFSRLPLRDYLQKAHNNPRNRYNCTQTNTSDLICGSLTFAHTFQLLHQKFFCAYTCFQVESDAKEGAKHAARFDSGHARTRERERPRQKGPVANQTHQEKAYSVLPRSGTPVRPDFVVFVRLVCRTIDNRASMHHNMYAHLRSQTLWICFFHSLIVLPHCRWLVLVRRRLLYPFSLLSFQHHSCYLG